MQIHMNLENACLIIHTDRQSVQPIIIAGTYEDKSNVIYNLSVIPALILMLLYAFLILFYPIEKEKTVTWISIASKS